MMRRFACLLLFVHCGTCAIATQTVPAEPEVVSIRYPKGYKAEFTYGMENPRVLSRTEERRRAFDFAPLVEQEEREEDLRRLVHPQRKLRKIEFIFADGRRVEVPPAEFRGLELIQVGESVIETLGRDDWCLQTRIRDLRSTPGRKVGDRVVFLFKNHQYAGRWLELNGLILPPEIQKLVALQIPKIEAKDAGLAEVVEFLALKISELDPRRPGGIGFHYQGFGQGNAHPSSGKKRLSYSVDNASVDQVLTDLARLYEVQFHVSSAGVVITPVGAPPFPNAKAEEGLIYLTYTP